MITLQFAGINFSENINWEIAVTFLLVTNELLCSLTLSPRRRRAEIEFEKREEADLRVEMVSGLFN